MNDSDEDLTRQEEDVTASGYETQEQRDHHDLGNWPEFAGIFLTAFVTWLIFAFTG